MKTVAMYIITSDQTVSFFAAGIDMSLLDSSFTAIANALRTIDTVVTVIKSSPFKHAIWIFVHFARK